MSHSVLDSSFYVKFIRVTHKTLARSYLVESCAACSLSKGVFPPSQHSKETMALHFHHAQVTGTTPLFNHQLMPLRSKSGIRTLLVKIKLSVCWKTTGSANRFSLTTCCLAERRSMDEQEWSEFFCFYILKLLSSVTKLDWNIWISYLICLIRSVSITPSLITMSKSVFTLIFYLHFILASFSLSCSRLW